MTFFVGDKKKWSFQIIVLEDKAQLFAFHNSVGAQFGWVSKGASRLVWCTLCSPNFQAFICRRGPSGANSMQLFAIVRKRRPEHISTIVPTDMTLHDVTVSGLFRSRHRTANDSIPINQRHVHHPNESKEKSFF